MKSSSWTPGVRANTGNSKQLLVKGWLVKEPLAIGASSASSTQLGWRICCVPCSKAELPREVLLPDWSPKNISLKLGTAHSAGNPLGCGKTQMVCLGV